MGLPNSWTGNKNEADENRRKEEKLDQVEKYFPLSLTFFFSLPTVQNEYPFVFKTILQVIFFLTSSPPSPSSSSFSSSSSSSFSYEERPVFYLLRSQCFFTAFSQGPLDTSSSSSSSSFSSFSYTVY